MKYKIGDRVKMKNKMPCRAFRPSDMIKFEGKIMTIAKTGFHPFIGDYYQMKEDISAWLGEEDIDRLIDEHKVVITTDGETTTAKLYDGKKFIKEAVAKCSPEDEFDFKTGAELAFKRLCGEEKEKAFFSEKAVYIRFGDFLNLTQGKIYNFTDGKYIDDVGNVLPCGYALYEEDLKAHGFLPIKE